MHLNSYGYEDLSDDEVERFERAFNEEGDEEAFRHLFGPEKIVGQIQHFLYCVTTPTADVRRITGEPRGEAAGRTRRHAPLIRARQAARTPTAVSPQPTKRG
jgi:hypothetical protein